jgi:hypothetical protein
LETVDVSRLKHDDLPAEIFNSQEMDAVNVLSEVSSIVLTRRLFNRDSAGGARLEMHMVGGRGATLGAVIKDGEPWTQVAGEFEKGGRARVEELGNMPDVRYSEMFAENGGGIAEDQEIAFVQYPLLNRRKILHTEKAPAIADGLRINLRPRADDASGIELQPDRISVARNLSKPDCIQRSIS